MDLRARQFWCSVNLILVALACNLFGATGARLLIWTPLLFFAPGYLLSSLFFKHDRLAAILIGVLISVCLVIFGGLLIGFLGQINQTGFSLWFCIIFSVCFFIHHRLGFNLPIQGAPEYLSPRPVKSFNGFLIMALVFSSSLIGGAYWMAIRSEAADSQFSFIEFWLLPGDISSELVVGLSNEEGRPQAFRIEVSADGITIAALTTEVLKSGQTIQSKISFTPGAGRVSAKLFRRDDSTHVLRFVSRDVSRRPIVNR